MYDYLGQIIIPLHVVHILLDSIHINWTDKSKTIYVGRLILLLPETHTKKYAFMTHSQTSTLYNVSNYCFSNECRITQYGLGNHQIWLFLKILNSLYRIFIHARIISHYQNYYTYSSFFLVGKTIIWSIVKYWWLRICLK